MFSTISSFLPTALQGGDHSHQVHESPTEERPHDHGGETDTSHNKEGVDELGAKKKKKEKTNENFIVVRPPPAKSNHPLNLQVQLVPPSARNQDRSVNSRQSIDLSAADCAHITQDPGPGRPAPPTITEGEVENTNGSPLARVPSNRSDVSAYTGYTSVASFSSISSTTTGGGRRMIIPLYNLQAHNVMTNLVVDAGTDAKVGKFTKKGIEVVGLAMIEPIEVWPRHSGGSKFAGDDPHRGSAFSTSTSGGSAMLHMPAAPSSRPTTPEGLPSRSLDMPRGPSISVTPVSENPELSNVMAPPPTGAKKMFGKLFKKKEGGHGRTSSTASAADAEEARSLSPARNSTSKRFSFNAAAAPPSSPTPSATTPTAFTPEQMQAAQEQSFLRPPVLGIQPSLSSPVYPPIGKPTKYVWVVRRWLKGNDGELLGRMIGKLNVSSNKENVGLAGIVEVRFEWTRQKSKSGKERGRALKPPKDGKDREPGSANHSRRASMVGPTSSNTSLGNGDNAPAPVSKARKRLSLISRDSASVSASHEHEHDDAPGAPDDDGDESDPEDSETPWTCTLRVSRPAGARGSRMSAQTATGGSEDAHPVKMKVATLSPTPHHPKVVALLKVPFPLADIAVERMAAVKRVMTPQGLKPGDPGPGDPLMLTAEEIKDVVSVTALWLIVREGFGGVGKVNRKGDGWRIRA